MELKLTQPTEQLRRIYTEAFPPEERRDWSAMPPADPAFAMYAITDNTAKSDTTGEAEKVIGLLTTWNFGDFTYIEHFAIAPDRRGGGIGTRVLDMLSGTLLLEVEPPQTSQQARDRIAFYTRNRFTLLDADYMQPPYSPEMPPIPLRLMARGPIADIREAIRTLHTRVYGVDNNK